MPRSSSSPFDAFLGGPTIEATARHVVQSLAAANQACALVGGAAMALYGSDRLTKDVDFIASAVPDQPGRALSFGGKTIKVDGVPVDIIVRDDEYEALYEDALLRRVHLHGLPVVRARHLATMKIVSGRSKDIQDLHFLIRKALPTQREAMRKTVVQFLGTGIEFDQEERIALLERKRERDVRKIRSAILRVGKRST